MLLSVPASFACVYFYCLFLGVSAYLVTFPNERQGWTNSGSQTLEWSRVDTDPETFAVVLSNQSPGGPFVQMVIADSVDGVSSSSVAIPPPPGGWPTGSDFRVNLVPSSRRSEAILAQSSEFDITDGDGLSTTTRSTSASRDASVSSTGASTTSRTIAISGASAGASTAIAVSQSPLTTSPASATEDASSEASPTSNQGTSRFSMSKAGLVTALVVIFGCIF